jgi:mannose-1-phosphate guanylyltransferase
MKALILVGGYGTRLRPLTFSCPKSIIPFLNKPMIEHQIEAVAKIGVKEVILAINYQADKITEGLKELEERYGIKIITSRET